MSSPPRSREREEQRRMSLRTLLIASIASATAAVVTSQFWTGGTPIAAAITPVIVALVSEMLHRPTEAIARRITSEGVALIPVPDRVRRPPPDRRRTTERPRTSQRPRPSERPRTTERPRTIPPPGGDEPPVRVYGREGARRRRKIAVGVVATTAALAFAIAAAALTLPELIAGHSLVKSDRNTTLVPTKRNQSSSGQQTTPSTTSTTPAQQQTQTTPQTTPKSTNTTPTQTQTTPKKQTQTTPTTPAK
jgi:hypothetical protein